MSRSYFIVEIEHPGLRPSDAEDMADAIATAIDEAIDQGRLMYMLGQSAGPNPPYERNPELSGVYPALED